MLIQGIVLAIEYDENHPDFPMTGEHMEKFAKRWLLHSLMWSFCGSSSWDARKKFSHMLLQTRYVKMLCSPCTQRVAQLALPFSASRSGVSLPGGGPDITLIDYKVRVDNGEYELWSDSVPRMEIESHRVAATDVVITTTDTVRHSDVLSAFLGRRLPIVLWYVRQRMSLSPRSTGEK
jgi:dynein heavy chain 1